LWQSRFGALPERDGVRFRVFAPRARDVRLHVLSGAAVGTYGVQQNHEGVAEFSIARAGAGDRYAYTVDGPDLLPDPASRFQPDGVHGPSEIVDPDAFRWRHDHWRPAIGRELVVYELHIGTFSEAGTFAAARDRLHELGELGVTAIELMPVADFAGSRNWGYDGVCLYAPSRNYGRPDDLRALIDAAHGLGLAVILDVVYNHLGPEGAYLPRFHPGYITDRYGTPWGGAVNLDGPGADLVRGFILDNALHWVREYRLDGLRLDATHALIDGRSTPIVAELAERVRTAASRPVVVHAEDHRNLASLVEPRDSGGWGLDGVWADDFHHILRRFLAGDAHGYYADFRGSSEELARTIRQGWLFTGQRSAHLGEIRGTDASRIPMQRFVICLQNHDQIGNRAHGERLHQTIDAAAWRAASTLLLTAPMTPLLFMGQEWAASSPFLYFTDLEPELGRLVTEGRRREFRDFAEFADPETCQRIPDPQAVETFRASKLNWEERLRGAHAASLRLYRELLALRRAHAALGADAAVEGDALAAGEHSIVMRRTSSEEQFVVVVQLFGAGRIPVATRGHHEVRLVLSTEDERFAADPRPPQIDAGADPIVVTFHRPGAVILDIE
jgi:maltooligosyltrehalose trehalohydrolase